MTKTMMTSPYTCDRLRTGSGYLPCGREAVAATRTTWRRGGEPIEGWDLLCKVHVAGMKRRTWPQDVVDLSADIREAVDFNEAYKAERAEEAHRVSKEKRAAAKAARIAREQAEVVAEWAAAVVIEDRPRYVSVSVGVVESAEASVTIYPVEQGPQGWDSIKVELDVDDAPAIPAVVKLRGGSPMTLNPSALALLAEVLPVVGEWADQMNGAA